MNNTLYFYKKNYPVFIYSCNFDSTTATLQNVRNLFQPDILLPDVTEIYYHSLGELLNRYNSEYQFCTNLKSIMWYFKYDRDYKYLSIEKLNELTTYEKKLQEIKTCFEVRGYHGCFVQFNLSERLVDRKLREYDDYFNHDIFDINNELEAIKFVEETQFLCTKFIDDKYNNIIIPSKINRNECIQIFIQKEKERFNTIRK